MGEMYKTNYDGAMFEDSEEAGIGVVVCNASGEVSAAFSEKILFSSLVDLVEVIVVRRATQFIVELGIS